MVWILRVIFMLGMIWSITSLYIGRSIDRKAIDVILRKPNYEQSSKLSDGGRSKLMETPGFREYDQRMREKYHEQFKWVTGSFVGVKKALALSDFNSILLLLVSLLGLYCTFRKNKNRNITSKPTNGSA